MGHECVKCGDCDTTILDYCERVTCKNCDTLYCEDCRDKTIYYRSKELRGWWCDKCPGCTVYIELFPYHINDPNSLVKVLNLLPEKSKWDQYDHHIVKTKTTCDLCIYLNRNFYVLPKIDEIPKIDKIIKLSEIIGVVEIKNIGGVEETNQDRKYINNSSSSQKRKNRDPEVSLEKTNDEALHLPKRSRTEEESISLVSTTEQTSNEETSQDHIVTIPVDIPPLEEVIYVPYIITNANGKSVEQDFHWYELEAKKGQSSAQLTLGLIYSRGRLGVEQNYRQGFHWFELSANQGNEYAEINLGILYFYGKGIKRDCRKSYDLLKKSAKNGQPKSQFLIAYMYKKGLGIKQNDKKSRYWLKKAKKQGYNNDSFKF